MKTFVLYSTEHCHLCELAEQVLVHTLDANKHQVEVEDIANSDLLLARYGIRIPVLVDLHSKAELQWPFDVESVQKFIG